MSNRTISECGKFKQEIHTALYKSDDIKKLILGNTSDMSQKDIKEFFREHVKSHLFIDDTITESTSYIFYDIRIPKIHSNTKRCEVILYAICHRDILDDYIQDGYCGNRADILSQMVEDCLINNKNTSSNFGIGELSLDSVDIYNSTRFYGRIMMFNVPNFR